MQIVDRPTARSKLVDWSNLPPELLQEIATSIQSIEDFMAFRGVCTPWRSAAATDKFMPSPSVPLLMLPRKGNSDECEFYNLSKNKISMRLAVPEIKDKLCFEVRFGWLLILAESRDATLLNPLTRAQVCLPNIRSMVKADEIYTSSPQLSIRQGVLSDNPSKVSNFTLLAMFHPGHVFAFWKPGDSVWTKIETSIIRYFAGYTHVNFLGGKFYIIDDCCNIWIWNGNSPLARHCYLRRLRPSYSKQNVYLVKRSSLSKGERELLFVTRSGVHFNVRRLNTKTNVFEYIDDIGGDAIFVGHNAAIYFSETEARRAGIKGNRVYFAYHGYNMDIALGCFRGKDIGIYNYKDRSIEMFEGVDYADSHATVHSCLNPPSWISSGNCD